MDAVITFVNGLDPVWQREFAEAVGVEPLTRRYRDWGLLKYLLRGIETFMPYIDNVFLVISGPTQVPHWADCSRLKVILHRDIIPHEYLPVFNSTAIEMFLHRIPGLGEEFIYFNDDVFPVMPCLPTVFFDEGRAGGKFAHNLLATNLFKKTCRNADIMARRALGMRPSLFYIRSQHICSAMFRSQNEQAFAAVADLIPPTITKLREGNNLCQFFFTDYLHHKGLSTGRAIPKKHFSLAVHSADKIAQWLDNPTVPFICINDVDMPHEKFLHGREQLQAAFQKLLPDKSSFEL